MPLGTILLLATLARLYHLGFGLPSLLDPDEPMFLLGGLKLLRNHTLDPGWFGHPGSTTIYSLAVIDLLVFGTGWLTGRFASPASFSAALYHDPTPIVLPSRLFIALCGVICVWLTFLIGQRLFDRRTGLLAALMLAVNPLHIQWSQVVRTDVHATVFMLASVIFAIRVAERGRGRDLAIAGALAGFACATKWPAAIVVIVGLGACWIRARDEQDGRVFLRPCALLLSAAVVGLFVASPFLLLDYPALVRSLKGEIQAGHLGATGEGLIQNGIWYVRETLLPPMGVAGVAFTLWGIARSRHSAVACAILLPFTLIFFGLIAAQSLRWTRWIVPLLPFLTLFAAHGLWEFADWAQRWFPRALRPTMLAVLLCVLLAPIGISALATARERGTDTRLLAEAWVRQHVPAGSSVLVEYFALRLTWQPITILFPIGGLGCIDGGAALSGGVNVSTADRWRGGRALVDIGTLDPAKLDTCRPNYVLLSDYDRYRVEGTRYPEALAIYATFLRQGREVARFVPAPGRIGGPVVRVIKLPQRARSTPRTFSMRLPP